MADEKQDVRSLLDKIAKGNAKDTPGGSHETEQDLKEDAEQQSKEKKTDKTVQDVGEPNVEEGKTEPEKDNPPAQVSEEASTDQTGDAKTPGGSHETEKDLKEQPSKKAELAQKIASDAEKVTDSLDDLLGSVDKTAADEKQDGEDTDKMDEESSDEASDSSDSESSDSSEDSDSSEEDTSDKTEEDSESYAKEAGRQAAQQVALLALQQAQEEKQAALEAEMSKYAQMGQADAMALADQLDAGVEQAMGASGAAGAPEESPEEPTKSMEEVKAIAQTLLDGKQPETPEEKEIAQLIDWVKSQAGSPGSGEESKPDSEPSPEEDEDKSGESEPSESAKKEEKEKKKAALEYFDDKSPEEVVEFLNELSD